MRHIRPLLALASAASITTALAAQDVVVMRRQIAPPTRTTPVTPAPAASPTPTPTPTPTPSPAPTPTPSPTPTPTPTSVVLAWVAIGPAVADAPSCSATAPATRPFECRADDVRTDDARCASLPPPQRSTTVEDRRSCTYAWDSGGFGPYTSTCSTTATREQAVSCMRSGDATTGRIAVDDSFCPAATMPTRKEGPLTVTSGCSSAIVNGTFVKKTDGSGEITGWTGDIGSVETSAAGAKFKTTSGPVQLSQSVNLTATRYMLSIDLTNNITFDVNIGGVNVLRHTGTPYSSRITKEVTVAPGLRTFQLRSSFLNVNGTDYGGNPVVNNVKLTEIPK